MHSLRTEFLQHRALTDSGRLRRFLWFALLSTVTPTLASQEVEQEVLKENRVEAKRFRAVRVADAPVMDGALDDAVWQEAQVVTDFHQSRPGDHAAPSEPTELYVVYTLSLIHI